MPELAAFEGQWAFARRIEHADGMIDHAQGQACFAPDPAGLWQDEQGVLTLARGGAFRFERRYLWQAQGGLIHTRFADGRAFHDFDPALARPQASHDCAPDTYTVAYDFTDWPVWRAQWHVQGPNKAYWMITRYHRSGEPLHPAG